MTLEEQVIAMWRGDATYAEIQAHFQISRDRVRKILTDAGLRAPPKPGAPAKKRKISPTELDAAVSRLHAQELHCAAIALKLQVPTSWVHNSLHKQGLKAHRVQGKRDRRLQDEEE